MRNTNAIMFRQTISCLKAFQVSTNNDVSKLFQQIVDLDIINNYYLKKPSSSWVLAGLPNMEKNVYFMKIMLLGWIIL